MNIRPWLVGPLLWHFGLFGLIVTANPWGTPAVEPWFMISGWVAGLGLGMTIWTLKEH